jgi:hypothetical protein
MPVPGGIDPGSLSAHERIAEIADILAGGLIRLDARKSSETVASGGDSFVDFSPAESGHAPKGEGP